MVELTAASQVPPPISLSHQHLLIVTLGLVQAGLVGFLGAQRLGGSTAQFAAQLDQQAQIYTAGLDRFHGLLILPCLWVFGGRGESIYHSVSLP